MYLGSSMKEIVVGIHQPNFFPWIGFFEKISRSDIFVFLDKVQYSGGSWSNRVKVINQMKPSWITCPILHTGGHQYLDEVRIDEKQQWKKKFKTILEINYSKSDYFPENFEFICKMIEDNENHLSGYNILNIKRICEALDIKTDFYLQSDMVTNEKATGLVIEITKQLHGTAYLCGAGSANYQDDDMFSESHITLLHQNFVHPVYPQITAGNFIPGMSIIDVLLNCGVEGTKKLLSTS